MTHFSKARHACLPFCRDRINFSFKKEARPKGDHSAGRDHHSFARFHIASLTSALTSHRKPAEAFDDDRVPVLKGSHDELKNPIQQGGRLFL